MCLEVAASVKASTKWGQVAFMVFHIIQTIINECERVLTQVAFIVFHIIQTIINECERALTRQKRRLILIPVVYTNQRSNDWIVRNSIHIMSGFYWKGEI